MHATFGELGYRGQVGRLRGLARAALEQYDLGPGPLRLKLLAHMDNTTFRVDSASGRYVLRVHRASHSPAQPRRTLENVGSEMQWLAALRLEAGLTVPEPIASRTGAWCVTAESDGVPGERVCSLLGWVPGRFVNARLTPSHLERVGVFLARLQDQAADWDVPPGFERGQVGELPDDVADSIRSLMAETCGHDDIALVERLLPLIQQTQHVLGQRPGMFGLIHGDLHQDNYLFEDREVCAIDFDDCGFGWHVYDLAVPLSEVRFRPDYPALRAALLRGYRQLRSLRSDDERTIDVFIAWRFLQLTVWFLEHRNHPGFADWELDVRYLLDGIRTTVDGLDTPEV